MYDLADYVKVECEIDGCRQIAGKSIVNMHNGEIIFKPFKNDTGEKKDSEDAEPALI
jgi:hypothetical protein